MTWSRLTASATIVCVAASGAARADSASDLETARLLLKEANALRDSGDLRGALTKYKAAHALVYTPITGLEVGRTHLRLGELVEAREAFLSVGRIPVKAQESQNASIARIEADRLGRDLAPRIPTLNVVVKGVPADVATSVEIDGQASAMGPRKCNPGTHQIVAKASGYMSVTEHVTLAESETRTVTLELVAAPKPPPIVPAKPMSDRVEKARSPLVYAGFGVAAVSVVVGGITGAIALSKKSALDSDCIDRQCGPSHQDALHSARTYGTVSTIAFATAGAGAILGFVGWFGSGTDGKPQSAAAHVTIGWGTVGVGGAF